MILSVLLQTAAAVLGTVAFSLLYDVPRRCYPYCGLIGGCGWFCYSLLILEFSPVTATFYAAVLIVILSRIFAVREQTPVTLFLIPGIFPLVPGAGIYWTSYYIVTNQLSLASQKGFLALKSAVAIVLGIVVVLELPQRLFDRLSRRPLPPKEEMRKKE